MQDLNHYPQGNVWTKLTVSAVILSVFSVLIAEGIVSLILPLFVADRAQPLHIILVVIITTLILALVLLWIGHPIGRRVQRLFEISRAWLRGNLAARIGDASRDDLGLLSEQLDLLAEHLEQDEQDLHELRERNARLADQVRALAVVEERNRLARELHDSVKQYLFSLAMIAGGLRARFERLISAGETEDAPDPVLVEMINTVREVETTAQTAQREITRLITDLRPGSLEEQGLAAVLNDYALLFGAREHILAYVDVQGSDALLAPSVAEALYRVAQEALHNVARHARATRVDVRLRCLPEQAILTVRDNGVGFDTQQARRGLGLSNMQERIMAVDGQVTVDSRSGRGTTVTAKVVLAQPVSARREVTMPRQQRPEPRIENWAWLGRRLVIPVGQIWPWSAADEAHLRQPLVEPGGEPLLAAYRGGLLSRRGFEIKDSRQRTPLARVRRIRAGYEWKRQGAVWAVRYVGGRHERMVLSRNGQPLAALQSQGRLMNAWSELVYDGRGYRLTCAQEQGARCALVDQAGEEIVVVKGSDVPQIELCRAIPLPLLLVVAARIADDVIWLSSAAPVGEGAV